MIELRDYQLAAVEALRHAWTLNHRKVILELGPGAGKSLVAAEISLRALKSQRKVLVMCHQKEILVQNLEALKRLSSTNGYEVDATTYCDGLGQKDPSGDIVFASRDSWSLNPDIEQYKFNLLIIDEAHRVSALEESRYQQIIKAAGSKFVIGMTATPYRLAGGLLYGEKKPFSVRAYRMGIGDLIQKGYLCPFDIKEKAVDLENIQATAEMIKRETKGRICTLIFCQSRAHASEISKAIPGCQYLDGETPQSWRDSILAQAREGRIPYIANVGILTTGVDIPICDCVVMLRPTESASLWVQMIGRALRIHNKKTRALIIETTDNLDKFGDVAEPMYTYGKDKENSGDHISGGGEALLKVCPSCEFHVPNNTKVCPYCGNMFITNRDAFAGEKVRLDVHRYVLHEEGRAKSSGNRCRRVDFYTRLGVISEWLMMEHQNPVVVKIGQAKLRRLKEESKVTSIRVTNLEDKLPRILTYH